MGLHRDSLFVKPPIFSTEIRVIRGISSRDPSNAKSRVVLFHDSILRVQSFNFIKALHIIC